MGGLGVAEMRKYVPVEQPKERPHGLPFRYIAAASKQRTQYKRQAFQLPSNPKNKTQSL